jgi:hypothetical protein
VTLAKNEVRVVFCDISKAFDRVWHNGLLTKLKSIGIQGPLLSWIKNYLLDRKQRVVINGCCSHEFSQSPDSKSQQHPQHRQQLYKD